MQKKTRPTLAEIAQLLVSGEFDGFVVYDLSRFMRYERAYHDFMEDFVFAEKITFVSAMDNIDLDDPNGRMMASIMITMHAMLCQELVAEYCPYRTRCR
jgi:DNA invertase Pin-like site-specific DNA recombinase